jgi:hypothetical protein
MIMTSTKSTKSESSSVRKISAVLLLLVQIPLFASAQFACTDLTNLLSNDDEREAFETFAAGGDIVDTTPLFINVPRMSIVEGNVETNTLCLEDIPIPNSIKGVKCINNDDPTNSSNPADFWNNCFLAMGIHAEDDDQTEQCAGNNGDIGPCYNCVCSGSEFGTGQPNRTVVSGCGISYEDNWAIGCDDVQNGRGYDFIGGSSNYFSFQVSVCPVSSNNCGLCRGGSQAPFKVSTYTSG